MAAVVFLRGANVGGHRTFRPAAFAAELAELGVVNIGAAGTFVVRATVGASALRAEFVRRLPIEADLMICRARDVTDLTAADPFPRAAVAQGVKRFVSVLAKSPASPPALPLDRPAGRAWEVKVVALRGKFALSLWRRAGKALLYPNEVVEKELDVRATTRTWDTLLRIRDVLRAH